MVGEDAGRLAPLGKNSYGGLLVASKHPRRRRDVEPGTACIHLADRWPGSE